MVPQKIREGKVFVEAFVVITRQLASVDLMYEEYADWDIEGGFICLIHTRGAVNLRVACHMNSEFSQEIVSKMYGGDIDDVQEMKLYLNEYMNIVCGYAVSRLNDTTGTRSRISVPQMIVADCEEDAFRNMDGEHYCFSSDYGDIRVSINPVDDKED